LIVDHLLLLKSFGTGLAAGIGFSLLRLPIPGPTELASIIGIIGLFTGMLIVKAFVLH
jgi:XapX domain-containing protein